MTELQPRLRLDEDVVSHFRTVHVTERSRRDDQLCDECHVSQAGADDKVSVQHCRVLPRVWGTGSANGPKGCP